RNEWRKAKGEVDALTEQIDREEELRSLDDMHARSNTPTAPLSEEGSEEERRSAAFEKFMRSGREGLSPEERKLLAEMRAQGTSPNEAGGYT
ncbi:phage major capsid protein, partial [Escherichia coli]|uniref:phage major capsid protein n=2 Tax=Enterobacteriaceae TaxID=543 RepID=UPI0018693E2A